MLRMIGGAVFATVWLMVWGFLFWAMLLPENSGLIHVADEPGFAAVLKQHLPGEGTYYIPQEHEDHGTPRMADSSGETVTGGVIAMVHFSPAGGNPLSISTYLMGTVHFFAASLVLALLLGMALPALDSYAYRVFFLCMTVLFGIIGMEWTDPVWYRVPWDYFMVVSGFLAVGWFVASLIIAWFVRPQRGYKHVTDTGKPLWKRALDVD